MSETVQRDDDLLRLIAGYMPAFTIGTALRLGILESVGEAGMTADELARVTSTHAPSLTRVLRALAALGVLAEDSPGTFRLTPRGALLRREEPGSLYGIATVMLDESMWGAWPALDHTVRTGQQAFEYVYGTDYMTHTGWADGSPLREPVDLWMIEDTRSVAPFVVSCFDFGRFSKVVDVGGGSGPLVATILAAHPHLRGIVLDCADGIAHTPRVLGEAGVADRCEIRTGDFFVSVPPADVCVCKSVVFNWADDDRVLTIFRNCRRALPREGRLLLVEQMLPPAVDGSIPADLYLDDVNSIVSLGGRFRTEPEYRALLAEAGFDLTVHAMPAAPAGYTLLEATPR
jgi:hypothetical protein